VRGLQPDFARLGRVEARGVIATAPGTDVDFVSRFFAPRVGVLEDPVTGSAHTRLTPYWSKRLGKTELSARQVSRRGGSLRCRLRGDRVDIAGQAVLYLTGTITI
jgi:predicted PhzF superfamily epimerase YddE/YHI9